MSEVEDTRSRILAAAGPVFAEKGYEQATVREICQAAEVNVAAINYYFGDKMSLYIETVRSAHGSIVQRVPLPEWPNDVPAPTKLRDFVRTLLTRMLSRDKAAWQPRLMLREIMRPTEACRSLVDDYFRPHFQTLVQIVEELLPDSTPRHQLEQTAFSIVGQCLFYRVSGEVVGLLVPQEGIEQHYQIAQLAEHISSFSLAAITRLAESVETHAPVAEGAETNF